MTFLVQAVLVILAVFIFSYFDPFNIFNSKKLTMKDTPVVVNSIKGIGILITAEYYGEVIKSTGEPLQLFIDSVRVARENSLLELEETLRRVTRLDFRLDSARKEIRSKDRYVRDFAERHRVFKTMDNTTYEDFLSIARDKAHVDEAGVLYAYYTGNEVFTTSIGMPSYRDYVSDFGEKNYRLTRKDIRDTERDGLVLLGRGSVKAGIDFSNFDEKHFQYLPSDNLVRLLNHPTSIITASINPWFIPEKKIKGFDYIFVGNTLEKNPDSRKSVKIIQNLKSACLEGLKADAREAGIISQARENAEVTLAHFLSLLMGKDIRVEIFDHPLDAALHDILKGGKVDAYDLHEIDSLVDQFILTDYSRTYDFVRRVNDSLIAKTFQNFPWKNANQNLEALSLYTSIAEDSFYTSLEKLKFVRSWTARYDRRTAAKSYLYALVAGSAPHPTRLTKVNMPDSAGLRSAFDDRKQHFAKLATRLAELKTTFKAKEIKAIDSTIAALLKAGNLKDAHKFFLDKTKFATDEQRENLNWRFAYYFAAAAERVDTISLQVDYRNVGANPSQADIFYYLEHSGRLESATNLKYTFDKLLTMHPAWVQEAQLDFQEHCKLVENLLHLKPIGK
ncbi:MAG TPA: DUF4230 domain-containing protein [Cyclobacteriaceae bacterium]|nr:DUF4230 domain-containing protein [Cyclobacteriaceae bacterium]